MILFAPIFSVKNFLSKLTLLIECKHDPEYYPQKETFLNRNFSLFSAGLREQVVAERQRHGTTPEPTERVHGGGDETRQHRSQSGT